MQPSGPKSTKSVSTSVTPAPAVCDARSSRNVGANVREAAPSPTTRTRLGTSSPSYAQRGSAGDPVDRHDPSDGADLSSGIRPIFVCAGRGGGSTGSGDVSTETAVSGSWRCGGGGSPA